MIRPFTLFLLLTFGLTGCYLPASFDAEIEINRSGFYKIAFDGYLAEINLFNQIESGKLSRKEEAEKVERLKTDFMRDTSTKEFSYFKQGHFKVVWETSGDILATKMATFVRRNENMFSISYSKRTALVTIRGASLSKANAKRLTAAGLGMKGQLRVKTDARIIKHNADKVKKGKGREKIYVWNFRNLYHSAPVLTFNLR